MKMNKTKLRHGSFSMALILIVLAAAVLSAVLCAAVMVLGFSACSSEEAPWVVKYQEYEITPGEYIMQVISAYGEA